MLSPLANRGALPGEKGGCMQARNYQLQNHWNLEPQWGLRGWEVTKDLVIGKER